MSVTIRLSRTGRKKAPAFKIIATDTRNKRDGKFLDILGHYNPSVTPEVFKLDNDKLKEWKSKGAKVSEAVQKLSEGSYEYKHYDPHAKKDEPKEEPKASEEPTEDTTETPSEESSE